MRKILLFLSFIFFVSSISYGQKIKDRIIKIDGEKLHFEYDASWSEQKINQEIAIFKANYVAEAFRTSPDIVSILEKIPPTDDPCKNGDFEDQYNTWTGLSLRHSNQTLPIENGLTLNPGIASLPFPGGLNVAGQNYTHIESAGLDPLLLAATPSVSMQKTGVTTPTHSLRLGNNKNGYSSEGIAKRFKVTEENMEYRFQYAIIMDKSHSNSDGSMNGSEVFFIAEAVDMNGNSIDKVVDVGNPNNPFIQSVNNGHLYYRDWHCEYLDLSGHVGEEVVIMFINSDCAYGGHKGYTYLDDFCSSCINSEGEIDLNIDGNCLVFPETVWGDFTVPNAATNVNISLDIYHNNNLVNTLTGGTVSSPNYSFDLQATDFPNQTPGTCYDLVSVLQFDIIDIYGNPQTVTQLSSKEVGGVQDGEIPGLDNDVCFCEVDPDFCCDNSENLIKNGHFEYGNANFSSAYNYESGTGLYDVVPGEYNVTNNAGAHSISPLWDVADHSYCTIQSTNSQFLVVNGKTTQASGQKSTIWVQGVDVEAGKEYRFCANFKNMPQCTFDILPKITIRIDGNDYHTAVINTTADKCDWQLESFCFRPREKQVKIEIILDEDGLGDGNDLAIDDISLQKLADPNLSITVQHQGTPQQITGSINTISTSDDILPSAACGDLYYWFVYAVESVSGGGNTINLDLSKPYGWGNSTGSSIWNPASTGPAWELTTTFPGYTFEQNQLYMIGMWTPSCCEGCVSSGFTYQLTYNNKITGVLSQKDIDMIIKWLGTYDPKSNTNKGSKETSSNQLNVHPNPTGDVINIDLKDSKIESYSISNSFGYLVLTDTKTKENTPISVSNFNPGVYVIKVKATNGQTYSTKFIKK